MSEIARNYFDNLFQRPYEETKFAHGESPDDHWIYPHLKSFLQAHDLLDKACLEVGTGYGQFQHLVPNYIGLDIAASAARYMEKPFVNASATDMPFEDERFDCVWSNFVLEHVSEPERMLEEIWRVLRPGGHLFLCAAWQCGPWLAKGYPVRPYSDFDLRGRLVKASIPIRRTVFWRSLKVFPLRTWSVLRHAMRPGPVPLRYKSLRPTYERRWMPDSTAETSVEPFDVYMWLTSRGAKCLTYRSLLSAYFIRTGYMTFCKPAN